MGHAPGLYLKVAFFDLLTALCYRDVSDAKKRLKKGSKSLLLNCPASGSHERCGFFIPLETGHVWVTEYGSRYAGEQH